MTVTKTLVLDLASKDSSDPNLVGGKAANLHRLIAGGLPVPPGLVIIPGIIEWELDSAFSMPPLYNLDLHRPFAVRSSAAIEDSSKSSYAGQFKSFLFVNGRDHVRKLVPRVAMASSNRLTAYMKAMKAPEDLHVRANVIVQPMVFATRSIVGFTVNPVTGEKAETIEVVKGCGETLVSGKMTPCVWENRNNQLVKVFGPEIDLPEPETLLSHMRKCRELLGTEVDVEASHDDTQWWLLQARPVTTK